MKDVFGQPFEGPIIPFGSLVEYHPITAKDQSRIHQFGKKVSPELFLGYALYAGRIWKGDVLIAELEEELETMDASGNLLEKTQCERGDISQRKRDLYFPIADGRIKNPWRRSGTENIHLDTGIDQFKERVVLTFLENQKGLFHNLPRLTSGCR